MGEHTKMCGEAMGKGSLPKPAPFWRLRAGHWDNIQVTVITDCYVELSVFYIALIPGARAPGFLYSV